MSSDLPSHHADRGFRNPWPTFEWPSRGAMLRWHRERSRADLAPNPDPARFPRAVPDIARPAAPPDTLGVTWIGHSSWLLQIGGLNVLTDPHFSPRASPLASLGPRRFSDPGVAVADLPPIDLVLLSHDHYDHLDVGSVKRLHERFGDRVRWVTPLGYRRWFARFGIVPIELDWWETKEVTGTAGSSASVTCLPAQHWTSRTPFDRMRRLWSSWSIESRLQKLYFGGDSGWYPDFGRIGEAYGPFDAVLMPIGAYEPRWFMKSSHMNPAEAVRAYRELGGTGLFGGMHWGTFRLTDEDPLDPPRATHDAWLDAGLPEHLLWIPAHGETRWVPATKGSADASVSA